MEKKIIAATSPHNCLGRKRGGVTNRRKGAADLQAIRAVKSAVAIPVVANGNVRSWKDVMGNLSVNLKIYKIPNGDECLHVCGKLRRGGVEGERKRRYS